jgi:hypothetical protein
MVDGNFYHACGVVTSDDSVTCWGWNGHGQLGDGTLYDAREPVTIAEFRNTSPTRPGGGGGGGLPTISVDAAGGSCIDGSERTSVWRVTFTGFRRLPGPDQCTKPGFQFLGWAAAIESKVVLDLDLVTDRGTGVQSFLLDRRIDVIAVWQATASLDPVSDLTVFANFLCGPCTNAWLLFTMPADATGYTVSVNDSSTACTQSGTFFDLSLCEITGLTPGPVIFSVTPRNDEADGSAATIQVILRD